MLREDRRGFPDTDFPADGIDTIARAARWARDHYRDREAIIEGTRRLTFDQYIGMASAVAKGLIAAGLEIGDRVAIWAPNSIDFALATVGTYMAGAVLVPVNTRFKAPEVDFIVRQARIKFAFAAEEFLTMRYADVLAGLWPDESERPRIVRLGAAGGDSLSQFLADGALLDDEALNARVALIGADDIASILFTSGTTGRPKGAMLRHGAIVRGYWTFSGAVGVREGDRYLCSNPFFHAFGLMAGLLASLMRGAAIYPMAVFSAERALEIIERERITFFPGPPTVFQELLKSDQGGRRDISSLRASVIGATTLPAPLIRAMYDRLGFEEIHSPYGFTEGTALATVTIAPDSREIVATTAGLPLPGIDVRVVRPDGSLAAPGEVGEIVVGGWNRMAGYLDPVTGGVSDGSERADMHSGDLGELDEDGYLRVRGRIKDMFIAGGFNVYPAEVEACLEEMPQVESAAVVAMPDRRLGEVGCAFIVSAPGQQVTEAEISAWCRERIANFKVPRAVVFVSELPMNATGKVAKAELSKRVPMQQGSSGENDY